MPVFGAFFWCESFHPFGLNMETYRVSPRIHSECGVIRARPTPNANTFHAVDVRTLLHYYNTIALYCKFAVISWLKDCEDMKLVVRTHVVLFH